MTGTGETDAATAQQVAIGSTGPNVRRYVVDPMLDLLDAFVAQAHKYDPHPYGHHNHHLCIHVNEWHRMLDNPDSEVRQDSTSQIVGEVADE